MWANNRDPYVARDSIEIISENGFHTWSADLLICPFVFVGAKQFHVAEMQFILARIALFEL